jgi:hypothetical protein
MYKNQRFLPLDVTIIDDNQWEPDETFFVKLSLYGANQEDAKIGHNQICMVTIIDDDGMKKFIIIIIIMVIIISIIIIIIFK